MGIMSFYPHRSTAMLLCILPFLILISPAHSTLERLRKYQRHCFETAIPCVMFMNEAETFGCSQCSEDTIQERIIEFSTQVDLERFIRLEEAERRIIMIPEFLLFRSRVMSAMASDPRNIAAVIVYEGESPASITPIPFPPFNSPEWSVDYREPNMGYNYPPPENTTDQNALTNERNGVGTSRKFFQYRFNIFRVNQTTADDIRNRTMRFVQQDQTPGPTSPRYKVQSNGRMFACPNETSPTPDSVDDNNEPSQTPQTNFTVTSDACLSEKTCLPIGGHSVWSALERINNTVPAANRTFLAVNTPMDSLAFFNDLALGTAAEISSLAAMLAVAQAVANYRRGPGAEKEMVRQPVYFAWSAQSWGYAGSSRFMEDVHNFACRQEQSLMRFQQGCEDPFMPSLKFLDFKDSNMMFLNIGPLAYPNEDDDKEQFSFYTQRRQSTLEEDESESEIEAALRRAFDKENRVNIGSSAVDLTPLDASQTFRQYRPESETLSVTNYDNNFTNTFYHSQYDDLRLINREPIYLAAQAIALTVVDLAFGDTEATVEVNTTVIDEVLMCMTSNWTGCTLALEYLGEETYTRNKGNIISGNSVGSFYPFPRFNDTNPSAFAKLDLVRSFLAYQNRYMDERDCNTASDCNEFFETINGLITPTSSSDIRATSCSRGQCVASDTFTHNAFGTGLNANNKAQSSFELINQTEPLPDPGNSSSSRPAQAAWTESVWDVELGLCGFTEDTSLFGGLILGAGILIFVLSIVLTYVLERILYPKKKSTTPDADPQAPSQPPV